MAGAAASWFVPYFWPDEPDNSAYANDYIKDKTTPYNASNWQPIERDVTKYAQNYRSGDYNTQFKRRHRQLHQGSQRGLHHAAGDPAFERHVGDQDRDRRDEGGRHHEHPPGPGLGLHAISPNQPFADGKAYDTKHLRKVIILMTDGQNTFMDSRSANNKNRSDYTGLGYIWQNMLGITSGTDAERTTAMDNRLKELCTNAKAKKIEIYTILVEGQLPRSAPCCETAPPRRTSSTTSRTWRPSAWPSTPSPARSPTCACRTRIGPSSPRIARGERLQRKGRAAQRPARPSCWIGAGAARL